ncbi:Multidrug resistance protein MdtA [Granulosicoccus antarcticus IMCC3135]|uniref:Multidrug resistance protein MdtA n=2 Tax=Granulosicoccus TaxID=437504 RepID=A0A2Z2NRE2_9GAMM|nr:Multidrug resistance protein MdtA [Granulosicoccus antarcticus IMCC3135]
MRNNLTHSQPQDCLRSCAVPLQATRLIRIITLSLSAFVASSLMQVAYSAEPADKVSAQPSIKPVKIMTLASQDMNLERTFFGRVSAKQSVDLAFQVGGQLFDFPAIEGAPVAKGSLVAKLDQEPFTLALDRAKASKAQADRTLRRLRQLQGNGATRASIDDAQTASTISAVAVRDAEYALEHATLSAPFDGVVAMRKVANYATIAAGIPVVRLHDLSELRIEIDVPEILFQRVGNDPNLEFVARFPASEELFPVEYREVDAEASEVGQTFRVSLGLTPPAGLLLFPGSSVTVIGRVLNVPGGITVPATAIYKETDGSTAVMRIEGDDEQDLRVVKTPVKIGVSARGEIQIMSGIESGTEIVSTGVSALSDGLRVRRFVSF